VLPELQEFLLFLSHSGDLDAVLREAKYRKETETANAMPTVEKCPLQYPQCIPYMTGNVSTAFPNLRPKNLSQTKKKKNTLLSSAEDIFPFFSFLSVLPFPGIYCHCHVECSSWKEKSNDDVC
jgi:hypothetical protein